MEGISKRQVRNLISDKFLVDMLETDDFGKQDELLEELVEDYVAVECCRYTYRSVVPKTSDLIGELLAKYDEGRFRSTVRMSREQFWNVLNAIKDHPIFQEPRQLPVSIQLLVTLHRFGVNGNSASLVQIAKDFGVGDGGTLNKITKRVIKSLLSIENNWIRWPDKNEREYIGSSMAEGKLPYCIGYVDGVHIGLHQAPEDDPVSYFNRKGFYSLNVQLICDPAGNIIAYHVGQPGKVHDSKVFSLMDIAKRPDCYFGEHEYLIGDSAYRLTENLITPYRRSQTRGTEEEKFNFFISSKRVKIEHVNGILKNRFGSLKSLRMKLNRRSGHQYACEWVTACLILHNMLHLHDPCTEESEVSEDMGTDFVADTDDTQESAIIKRNLLKQFICN